MKVLMFMSRFAPAVISGAKAQTIRPPRKRPIYPGDRLSLRKWRDAAYRSSQVRLREATCTTVDDVRIEALGITVAGERFNNVQANAFAAADGFADASSMIGWFQQQHGLPFRGVLIRWNP